MGRRHGHEHGRLADHLEDADRRPDPERRLVLWRLQSHSGWRHDHRASDSRRRCAPAGRASGSRALRGWPNGGRARRRPVPVRALTKAVDAANPMSLVWRARRNRVSLSRRCQPVAAQRRCRPGGVQRLCLRAQKSARLASGVVAARRRLPPAAETGASHPDARDPLRRHGAGSALAAAGTGALMQGPGRIADGLLTDPERPLGFRFDGQPMQGLAGDTLASALLANGRRRVARSFKYPRPRGIVTAGPEEPCALVDVIGAGGREPNQLATTLALYQGLVAESQNRWPSLGFDVMALNDLIARFLPAGFYYKIFMAPGWAWERLYEPLIRRAAGLGRLDAIVGEHAAPAETVHQHADVLVVGAGVAGLTAAQRLGGSGLKVMLVEQDVVLGAGALLDPRWHAWRETMCDALAARSAVRCLPRTTVVGAYGHGVFGALETLSMAESARFGGLKERLRIIRVRRVVIATGALERLIVFPGNDRPGVMLAGAALSYLRRYGVAVGRRPAYFVNSDEAYDTVVALTAAGIECAGVIDVRPTSQAADRARALGIEVHGGAQDDGVIGRERVRGVRVSDRDAGHRRELAADCLLMSGGYSPAMALASQLGAASGWQAGIAAFPPDPSCSSGRVVGAARGVFGLAAAVRDAETAAAAIAAELGRAVSAAGAELELPPDAQATPIAPLWEVRGRGKAFVDLQNDVTAEDVRLAQREGYEHVEHMKRYTTHGMATDQGRIGA